MGGAVKGQQILGKYPDSFTGSLAFDSNRGRMIPTTSWDSVSKLKEHCQIVFHLIMISLYHIYRSGMVLQNGWV